jgi:hypothetical protein
MSQRFERLPPLDAIVVFGCIDTRRATYSGLTSSWNRVLEKLIVLQLVKKFPTYCGIPRLITAFTVARQFCLNKTNA